MCNLQEVDYRKW